MYEEIPISFKQSTQAFLHLSSEATKVYTKLAFVLQTANSIFEIRNHIHESYQITKKNISISKARTSVHGYFVS
jgi:hypothetical protein